AVRFHQQGRGNAAVAILGRDGEDTEHQGEEDDGAGSGDLVDAGLGPAVAQMGVLALEGSRHGDQGDEPDPDPRQDEERAGRAELEQLPAYLPRHRDSPPVSSRKTSSREREIGASSEITRLLAATTRPISSPVLPVTTKAPSSADSTLAPPARSCSARAGAS